MAEFHFKQFTVDDADCAMKVGTDSVILGAWTDIVLGGGASSPRPARLDGQPGQKPMVILDLGAGSGLLALMAAQRCPSATIRAVEIDPQAAEAARRNFEASPWSDRLTVVCADALTYEPEAPVDLIVSNPPYFTSTLRSPDPRRAAARHCGDSFGPIALLSLATKWLSPMGSLAMITPIGDDDAVTFESSMARLNICRKCLVSTVVDRAPIRILWQISRQAGSCLQSSMAIRLSGGAYSPEYTALTRPFYLNL